MFFVCTIRAGSTAKGKLYNMKFNNAYGNICHRDMPRPAVLSCYFPHRNAVDINNQVQQGNLALEEFWVTGNGWFCLFTTFVGWTVTDTWFLRIDAKKGKQGQT